MWILGISISRKKLIKLTWHIAGWVAANVNTAQSQTSSILLHNQGTTNKLIHIIFCFSTKMQPKEKQGKKPHLCKLVLITFNINGLIHLYVSLFLQYHTFVQKKKKSLSIQSFYFTWIPLTKSDGKQLCEGAVCSGCSLLHFMWTRLQCYSNVTLIITNTKLPLCDRPLKHAVSRLFFFLPMPHANFWTREEITCRTPEKSALTGPSVNCGVTMLFTLTWFKQ